jgi:hypothetical protein
VTERQLSSTAEVTAAQREVIERVVGSSAPVRVLLLAPTGTGKSTVAVRAAEIVRDSEPGARILFVVATSIVAKSLRERIGGLSLVLMDRAALRDAEATAATVTERSLSIFVLHAALVTEAFRELVAGGRWDLVVVDDVDALSAAAIARVDLLARSTAVSRLLLIGRSFLGRTSSSHVLEIPVTDAIIWQLEPFVRPGPTSSIEVAEYSWTTVETAVIDRAEALFVRLEGWVDEDVIRRAQEASASSMFALTQQLLLLAAAVRERRNRAAHWSSETSELTAAERVALIEIAAELESLIADTETLSVDSKVKALEALLAKELQDQPVCIFVSDPQSALYLAAALGNGDRRVMALTGEGSLTPDELRKLAADQGVVVVTDAVLPAIDISPYLAGVHFDLVDAGLANERNGHLGTLDSVQGRRIIVLADTDRLVRDETYAQLVRYAGRQA